MFKTLMIASLILATQASHAETLKFGLTPETMPPPPVYNERLINAESKVLKTRIEYDLDENSPKTEDVWQQFIEYVGNKTGQRIELVVAESTLKFEQALSTGEYDLVHITPLQLRETSSSQNYRAIVKRKTKPLRALILVQSKDKARTLRDIEMSITGYSSLLNYNSSIIPRYSIQRLGLTPLIKLFDDDEALMSALDNGEIRAISLAEESYLHLSPNDQKKYKILWETPGFAPFAIAVHSRIPFYTINKLQRAMVNMSRGNKNSDLLRLLGAENGFETARSSDWLDAEDININTLNSHPNTSQATTHTEQ